MSSSESVSCLGISKKLSLGDVMSAKKHSLQTQDLARLWIDFIYIYIYIYIYVCVLITFLIFHFIGFL